jgi:hypothetical protein
MALQSLKGGKVAKFLMMTFAHRSTYYLFYGSSGLEKGGKVTKFLMMTFAHRSTYYLFYDSLNRIRGGQQPRI